MSNYDNTNRGVLFSNDRKEADNHPDITGSINIEGVEHWFSGWWKKGNKGDFLSLSIGKPKDQQQARQQPQEPARRPGPPSRGRGGYSSGYPD
jgi:hypothetical protein